MKNIIIDGVEYTPVVKETLEDNRHPWRYRYPDSYSTPHYYINSSGDIGKSSIIAITCAKIWNAFETKQEAEKELEKKKAIVTIKRYISNTFGVFEPDWSDENISKYLLIYDYTNAKMSYICSYVCMNYSPIWHLSCVEHLQEIIEKFDTELRLIFDIQ